MKLGQVQRSLLTSHVISVRGPVGISEIKIVYSGSEQEGSIVESTREYKFLLEIRNAGSTSSDVL